MASEILMMTAQIVISHVAVTELTTRELIKEIKDIYGLLTALEGVAATPEAQPAASRFRKVRPVKMMESSEARAVEDEAGPVLGDPDYMEFMESREG